MPVIHSIHRRLHQHQTSMFFNNASYLLLFVFACIIILLLSRFSLLPLHTSWTATAKWRCEGEINVFLRVETDNERGDIDDLFSDTTYQCVLDDPILEIYCMKRNAYRICLCLMRTRA